MVFDLLLLRQAIILIGCGAAAYTDAKTGLIFDKITYLMILAGIILNIIEMNWLFLGIGAAVFAAGYVIYYAGKIGGGDVKLYTGIAFLLPVFQGQSFLLNALFTACLLAVTFYSAYYTTKYVRQGICWEENKPGIRKALLFSVPIALWLSSLALMQTIAWQTLALLAAPLLLAILFLAFERGIRKSFFLREVQLQNLEEDEVIAAEFLDEKIREQLNLKLKGVFGEREIATLKKAGIGRAPVYRDMPPFAPFILLGCIAAMVQPNLLNLLFA